MELPCAHSIFTPLEGEGLDLDFYWKYRVINTNFGEDL